MDFAFKKAAQGSVRGDWRMHHFIVAQSMLFFVFTFTYGSITGDLKFGPHVVFGLIAGCFMYTGFSCFAWSLQYGNVSVNGPIFRLNFLVTAALAMLFLGESPTSVKLAGLALALVAIWLLVGAVSPAGAIGADKARRSLLLAIVATFALGCGNALHKVGLSVGGTPANQLAAHTLVYLALASIAAVRQDGRLAIPRAVWPVAAAGAVLGAGAFIAMMTALRVGQASVVVPIAQMGLVVSAALGVALLGEKLTGRKLGGLAAAVAALGLLAVS